VPRSVAFHPPKKKRNGDKETKKVWLGFINSISIAEEEDTEMIDAQSKLFMPNGITLPAPMIPFSGRIILPDIQDGCIKRIEKAISDLGTRRGFDYMDIPINPLCSQMAIDSETDQNKEMTEVSETNSMEKVRDMLLDRFKKILHDNPGDAGIASNTTKIIQDQIPDEILKESMDNLSLCPNQKPERHQNIPYACRNREILQQEIESRLETLSQVLSSLRAKYEMEIRGNNPEAHRTNYLILDVINSQHSITKYRNSNSLYHVH
jgi:hypothetical protein